jgi:UDP-N-acetylmuramoyl-tripeptide--D-alanyl-D-alanine ligase
MTLPVPGRHNVYNALAAAAVALHLGVPAATVAEGISHAKLTAMRMEIVETAQGVTVVNDAYNANPTSMRAAIDTLARMRVSGKKIAVLGDMLELGSLSELAHFGIGEEVAKLDIDVLVTVGESAVRIADGARAEGMPAERTKPCGNVAEAIEVLDDVVERGDVVLVKASRAMGLEAVVEGIVSPRV